PPSRSITAGCLFVFVIAVAFSVLVPGSAVAHGRVQGGRRVAARPERL
ncbi:hypothetical protein ABH939_006781, partial [Rhodococcus sp. 27YEA6]